MKDTLVLIGLLLCLVGPAKPDAVMSGQYSLAQATTPASGQPATPAEPQPTKTADVPKVDDTSTPVSILQDPIWGFWQTVIAAIALVAAGFAGLFRWWSGLQTRVRGAVAAAAPDLRMAVGSYAGSGSSGLHANIHNAGLGIARNLRLYAPGFEDAVWQSEWLAPNDRANPQVPVADAAPLRAEKLLEPKVTLEFDDRYGHQYRRVVAVVQSRRDDGRYNFGSTGVPTEESPRIGWREVWKLRKLV